MAASECFATERTDIPQMDTGAPLPLVLASDDRVLLSYLLRDGEGVVIVDFQASRAHSLGSPNDETLHGHPLARTGLTSYAVFEISNSPWIEVLRQIGSVHRLYNAKRFAQLKHYIFTFHDCTFECIAEGLTFRIIECESRAARLAATANLLG
jgi:hypothetical protein